MLVPACYAMAHIIQHHLALCLRCSDPSKLAVKLSVNMTDIPRTAQSVCIGLHSLQSLCATHHSFTGPPRKCGATYRGAL